MVGIVQPSKTRTFLTPLLWGGGATAVTALALALFRVDSFYRPWALVGSASLGSLYGLVYRLPWGETITVNREELFTSPPEDTKSRVWISLIHDNVHGNAGYIAPNISEEEAVRHLLVFLRCPRAKTWKESGGTIKIPGKTIDFDLTNNHKMVKKLGKFFAAVKDGKTDFIRPAWLDEQHGGHQWIADQITAINQAIVV